MEKSTLRLTEPYHELPHNHYSLFLRIMKVLSYSAFHPSILSPFQVKLTVHADYKCSLENFFIPRSPPATCAQLKAVAATYYHLSQTQLRSNTPYLCQRVGCSAEVVISLCRLIISNSKRKISSIEHYSLQIWSQESLIKMKLLKIYSLQKGALCHPKPRGRGGKPAFICHSAVTLSLS